MTHLCKLKSYRLEHNFKNSSDGKLRNYYTYCQSATLLKTLKYIFFLNLEAELSKC